MKIIRVVILISILIFVAFYSKLQMLESTSWTQALAVSVYPINGDGSEQVARYIKEIQANDYNGIETFLRAEYLKYDEFSQHPVELTLEEELFELPPAPPISRNIFTVVFWSLNMRWWSYQHANSANKTQVNIYVIYYQPKDGLRLAHSLGLQKGLIGVVNAFASKENAKQNNVVIAHELLHTVGATDKYNLQTGQPIFPVGFAKPEEKYNQSKAELMAGRIPINEIESEMPYSLRYCVVGAQTAKEIGWLDNN
ncbi:MAG: hypothetical protein COB62_05450 [Piscirickettsiaceae bacterium]|nr:MAG: hypothetical protein COB62_05450 [Piscirickettsiaceae bacterium]